MLKKTTAFIIWQNQQLLWHVNYTGKNCIGKLHTGKLYIGKKTVQLYSQLQNPLNILRTLINMGQK